MPKAKKPKKTSSVPKAYARGISYAIRWALLGLGGVLAWRIANLLVDKFLGTEKKGLLR